MIQEAALISVLSALVFCALVLMSDRKRGALIAQIGTALAAALIFAALVYEERLADAALVSAIGTGLLAATAAGMFYHLYLGRFTSVWPARGVFTLVYFAIAGLLGLIYLSFL